VRAPQTPLVTARLRLEPGRAGDLDALYGLFAEEGVRRHLCDGEVLPRDAVAAFLDPALAAAGGGLGLWMIRAEGDGASGALLGIVSLLPLGETAAAAAPDFAGEVEPMIALSEPHWGQGFGREAVTAVTSYGLGPLGLPRIVTLVDEPNARSRALMRACGYIEQGRFPGPKHVLIGYVRERPAR